jgi:hypothetical protein
MLDDAEAALLDRFAAAAAHDMLGRGWQHQTGHASTRARSIFLGDFEQPIAPDWVATVEFMNEGGGVGHTLSLGFTGIRRTRESRAVVGGQVGLRHVPTAALLRTLLDITSGAHISRDLGDIVARLGRHLPAITDEATADAAARELVPVADAHAVEFGRTHATVDDIVAFLRRGDDTSWAYTPERVLVPAILAAADRHDDALAAIAEYRRRPRRRDEDDDQLAQFEAFAQRLVEWLNAGARLDRPS